MPNTNQQSSGTSIKRNVREKRRCICGHPDHPYKHCHALNPYTRREMWVMTKPMVAKINKALHKDEKLREKVLQLGYEYYRPLEEPPTPEPVNPLHKLGNLPKELIEEILEWTWAMTLKELPESYPRLDDDITDANTKAYRRQYRADVPVPVILNLPVRAKSGSWRQLWLRRHPGNWGPLFQVMYVSKLFYEIGKPIRYREVHVQPPAFKYAYSDPSIFDSLCNRLTTTQVLKEVTKNIHLTLDSWDDQRLKALVSALAVLPKLTHLCVTLKGTEGRYFEDWTGNHPDLLQFFGLKIETLTFLWVCQCAYEEKFFEPCHSVADPNYAPVRSKPEYETQQARDRFIEYTYKPSSWYTSNTDESIPAGKAKLTHDWYAQKLKRPCRYKDKSFVQWDMDTFIFKVGRTTRPSWNLEKNPYNHASQLKKKEVESAAPLSVWRKGFDPWTPEEILVLEHENEIRARGIEGNFANW